MNCHWVFTSVVPTWQMDATVPGKVSVLVMSAAGYQQAVGM
jgi:hypothetical protein